MEDEDEEVMLQAVVLVVLMVVLVRREVTKYCDIHIVLSFSLLLAKFHLRSHSVYLMVKIAML